MLTLAIDKQTHAEVSEELKEMASVLAEITPTLETLQAAIKLHAAAIVSPTIARYRDELLQKILTASTLTREITDSAQKLVSVSDQASKHIVAIEEHFNEVLRDQTAHAA